MKRLLALLLISVMLLLPCGAFARGSYEGSLQVVNCDSWVTLRSGPSTASSRVCTVPKYAWVEAYYYNSEFMECYYDGYHGYILSTYLSAGNSGSSASSGSNYLGKMTIINCDEFVTMRSAPSTSASAVTRVARGQVVDAYYYDGRFAKCYYNGLCGYILTDYLSGGSYSGSGCYSYAGDYAGQYQVLNCDSWVSLRSQPSTSASRVCKVPKYATVEAYYYNSEFMECYYNGYHGYILTDYLY